MKHAEIMIAVAQAQRFIAAAKKVKRVTYETHFSDNIDTGKESGALRRASMDLTRQLAEMRKP